MKLAERLLLLLSKTHADSCETSEEEWNQNNALSLLNNNFPEFSEQIADKNVVDFGCDCGHQSFALSMEGARYVLGIEINDNALNKARNMSGELGLDGKVEFSNMISDNLKGKFDIVISQNSMEHFLKPVEMIEQMKYVLNPKGKIFLTFGPPWYAPYGSHMLFFSKIPWINICFSEQTVMRVRARYRNDEALRYEEVVGGLNKMTVSKLEKIISNCGMHIEYKKYDCVKGMKFLGNIPVLRELFINHISCILGK